MNLTIPDMPQCKFQSDPSGPACTMLMAPVSIQVGHFLSVSLVAFV